MWNALHMKVSDVQPMCQGGKNTIHCDKSRHYNDIVAYVLKARTVEPEKQPLLANGSETTIDYRRQLGKYVPTATDTHATIEVLYSVRAEEL
jgi:hypothetical protein